MAKNKTMTMNMVLIGLLVIIGVVVGALFLGKGNTTDNVVVPGAAAAASGCPTDLSVISGTVNVVNDLNTSGTETRDQTLKLYDADGKYLLDVTDTTSGDISASLVCGNKYIARLVSASGESALITSASGATVIENGKAISFTATSQTALNIRSKAMSGIQVKAYDLNAAGWVYDGSDADATNYETTGATFKSSTNNATATAIGTGGEFNMRLSMKSVTQYTDVADLGLYVLLNADTASYDENTFSLSLDGVKLTKVIPEGKEATAYKDYDAVYKVEAGSSPLIANNVDSKLEVSLSALSDVDPSADISIAFAPIGAVKEISGDNVRYSSVTDAASPVAVHTIQVINFDIS